MASLEQELLCAPWWDIYCFVSKEDDGDSRTLPKGSSRVAQFSLLFAFSFSAPTFHKLRKRYSLRHKVTSTACVGGESRSRHFESVFLFMILAILKKRRKNNNKKEKKRTCQRQKKHPLTIRRGCRWWKRGAGHWPYVSLGAGPVFYRYKQQQQHTKKRDPYFFPHTRNKLCC